MIICMQKCRWCLRLYGVAIALIFFCMPSAISAQEYRFNVLGLFHPKEIVVSLHDHQVLVAHAKKEDDASTILLNGESGHSSLSLVLRGSQIVANGNASVEWNVTARDGGPVSMELSVPGKLRRNYFGRLSLQVHEGQIQSVITMGQEVAVASIVSAEMMESAPMEALRAQAVVTRSFLVAGSHHLNYDFCDTTHCQFLKSPPATATRVWNAVVATEGQVLAFHGKPLAALYASRCGGRTHSLSEVGLLRRSDSVEDYPYHAVLCEWCRRHPLVWHRHLDSDPHLPAASDERQRILTGRQRGWNVLPGNDFTVTTDNSGVNIEGHNLGHGVGMCQFGAIGMAEAGFGYREILMHYYPNTSVNRYLAL